jgi:hypothetical protein
MVVNLLRTAKRSMTVVIKASSGAGLVKRDSVNYTTTREAASAQGFEVYISVGQYQPNPTFEIDRMMLIFDTSDIPAGAEITEVTLSLFMKFDLTTVDFDLIISEGSSTNPENPVVLTDYDRTLYDHVEIGSISSSGIGPANEFKDIDLDVSCIVKEGTTRLVGENSNDIAGNAPEEYQLLYFSKPTVENQEPKLTIKYIG